MTLICSAYIKELQFLYVCSSWDNILSNCSHSDLHVACYLHPVIEIIIVTFCG